MSALRPPVVVTRPAAQAGALAAKIAAIGRMPVLFPLLEIRPLPDPSALRTALDRLADCALVAFVSPNAIDACFAHVAAWPAGVPIAVMGDGSRAALARHGLTSANTTIVSPARTDRTDSQTLLEVLDLPALRGREVLIVRGEDGRELLADALRKAGARVPPVAAYRRCAPALDDAGRRTLQELIGGTPEWVVTSSEALRILLRLARENGGEEAVTKIQRQRLLVPHFRIRETAQTLGFIDTLLTGPGDDRLVAALQSRP
ncbi:MAG: uroporphyrinogen-III synthase [Burkholderiaceae bacterium]